MKVSTLFSNIFTRTKQSNLEVDAVPVTNNRRRQTPNPNNENNRNSIVNSEDSLPTTLMSNNSNNSNGSFNNMIPSMNFTNSSSNESLTLAIPAPPTSTSPSPTSIVNDNYRNFPINSNFNQLSPFTSQPLETLPSPGLLPLSSLNTTTTTATATNNNALAISNTQGHIVYQFSNIDGLHIGNVINVRSSDNGSSNENNKSDLNSQKQQSKPRTRTIQKMMDSKERLDHKMLDTISTHLGEGWKDIMRVLNFSEAQIHHAIFDYNIEGIKEVIYQLLLDWSRNEANANLGEITKILWKAGHRETVYYMKQSWKEINCNNESEI